MQVKANISLEEIIRANHSAGGKALRPWGRCVCRGVGEEERGKERKEKEKEREKREGELKIERRGKRERLRD